MINKSIFCLQVSSTAPFLSYWREGDYVYAEHPYRVEARRDVAEASIFKSENDAIRCANAVEPGGVSFKVIEFKLVEK